MVLNKTELMEKLVEKKDAASCTYNKSNKKCHGLAKRFLEDLEGFYPILEKFEDNEVFQLINTNSNFYKQKSSYDILYDSFSITLLQCENTLYMYCIAKYKLI